MPHALLVDNNPDTLDTLATLVRAEGVVASTAPTIELGTISRASPLSQPIGAAPTGLAESTLFGSIVGRSAAIRRTCERIDRIAPSCASVLITGESGTGKDVVARAIHDRSRHRNGPFVPVNCGAISAALMESEFFGHERGSFTGADRRHRGYFERAHRGTLFLDEITEMPLELQVKLLRVLETGVFPRVGGEAPISVDVRILAASNRDVVEALAQGTLREDLYYRLRVFELALPPLRERSDDVAPLVLHFIDQLRLEEGIHKHITPDALRVLEAYPWPGNVRELRNVVHSSFILAGHVIDVDALPDHVRGGGDVPAGRGECDAAIRVVVGTPLADVERRLIVATLRQCEGNKSKAAELLGISLKTLYNRVNEYRHTDANRAVLTAPAGWPARQAQRRSSMAPPHAVVNHVEALRT